MATLVCGLAVFPWRAQAQPLGSVQGFKFAEPYPAPHETVMKWRLEGDRGEQQPDGRWLITNAKWRTFRENGEGELSGGAPQCVYNPDQRTVGSAGPLHLQTADGGFSIDGEGFLWRQTNATLLVSNQVHTVIQKQLFAPQAAAPRTNAPAGTAPAIDIFSDRFDYAQTSGQGVYQGHVRVTGTNLVATAGRLTVLLPVAEHRLQSLLAEQSVVVDYENAHVTAERAFYAADTDIVQLRGQPTWRMDRREGSGDELDFERTNRVLRATGHARLQLPAESLGTSNFLSGASAAAASALPATNHFVEVLSQDYVLRTNLAVFRGDVRVSDHRDDQLLGQMTCALMTLTFAGSNELQTMVAERQVVIAQQDRRFTADRAEYHGTNNMLDLTGSPAWQAGRREGNGDLVRVNVARQEMLVRGNAMMKLPAAEVGESAASELRVTKGGAAKAATNEFAEIYCPEYLLTPSGSMCQGGVRVEHPRMKWVCGELTLLALPELGPGGQMLIAEPEVTFDATDDQGRTLHGTARKAIFTRRVTPTLTNELMELTGTPAVLQTTNLVGQNNIITLDLTSHKFTAPGKYKITGTLPEGATNLFQPTKRSPAKLSSAVRRLPHEGGAPSGTGTARPCHGEAFCQELCPAQIYSRRWRSL